MFMLNNRKKVLLLNPPGVLPYLRDYYCSKVSKTNSVYHPVDLQYLSGRVANEHEIRLIDCIAERIGPARCLSLIQQFNPDAVISLTGHVSWAEDAEFLSSIARELSNTAIIVTGDLFLEETGARLAENDFIDAALLDFTTDDILHYLRGDVDRIEYMHYRSEGTIAVCGAPRRKGGTFTVPVPRFELFPFKRYHYPFVRRRPFATVLTDYGCPSRCSFCVFCNLGYKCRQAENVMEELDALKVFGAKDIFFIDQTFGADQARTIRLLNKMIEKKYPFGFCCWTRADILTREMLGMMKKAGCHTLFMGAETANDESLKKYRKGYATGDIVRGFRLAKEAGLRTLGTFLFGIPGEDAGDFRNTIEFALKINPDFASFNLLIPRETTGIRKEASKSGAGALKLEAADQSGFLVPDNCRTPEVVAALNMMRSGMRRFYLRPAYIMKRLLSVKTFYELKQLISTGLHIISDRLLS